MIYLDGRIVPETEARIPVTDRGLQFGDGVFTTAKVIDGEIQLWAGHHQRLMGQCAELGIVAPAIIEQDLLEYIQASDAATGAWRLKVTVTAGGEGLSLKRRPHAHVIGTLSVYSPPTGPAKLCTLPAPMHGPLTKIKSLSYLHRLFLFQQAQDAGFDDVVTVNSEGYFVETAFSNLFWIVDKVIYTPSDELPLLSGLSLNAILENYRNNGCSIKQGLYRLEDIPDTAHIYTCNAMHTRAVAAIDERSFAVRDLAERGLAEWGLA